MVSGLDHTFQSGSFHLSYTRNVSYCSVRKYYSLKFSTHVGLICYITFVLMFNGVHLCLHPL